MLQVGLIDAYSHIPIHFDFLDDDNIIVNVLFSGFLGAAVGSILALIVREIARIIRD